MRSRLYLVTALLPCVIKSTQNLAGDPSQARPLPMSLSLLSFSDDFHRPLQPKKCLTGRYAAAVPSSPCPFFFYFSFFLGSDLKKGHRCIVTALLLRFFLPISPPPLLLPARLFVVVLRDQLCTRLQH